MIINLQVKLLTLFFATLANLGRLQKTAAGYRFIDSHMKQKFQQLQDIGWLLHFSPQESEMFAYKAMGTAPDVIAEKMGMKKGNYRDCASRIYKSLKIQHLGKHEKTRKIQELGEELLTHYDLVVAPLAHRNAEEILAGFHKLDEQLDR